MRRGSNALPLQPAPVEIILSVEISEGSPSSKVRVAVDASQEERNEAVKRWLDIMMFGLKQQGTAIEIVASIPREVPHAD